MAVPAVDSRRLPDVPMDANGWIGSGDRPPRSIHSRVPAVHSSHPFSGVQPSEGEANGTMAEWWARTGIISASKRDGAPRWAGSRHMARARAFPLLEDTGFEISGGARRAAAAHTHA